LDFPVGLAGFEPPTYWFGRP